MSVFAMVMALLAVVVMLVGIAGILRGQVGWAAIPDRRRGGMTAAAGFTVAVAAFGLAAPSTGSSHRDRIQIQAGPSPAGKVPGAARSARSGDGGGWTGAASATRPPFPTLPPYPNPVYDTAGTGADPAVGPSPTPDPGQTPAFTTKSGADGNDSAAGSPSAPGPGQFAPSNPWGGRWRSWRSPGAVPTPGAVGDGRQTWPWPDRGAALGGGPSAGWTGRSLAPVPTRPAGPLAPGGLPTAPPTAPRGIAAPGAGPGAAAGAVPGGGPAAGTTPGSTRGSSGGGNGGSSGGSGGSGGGLASRRGSGSSSDGCVPVGEPDPIVVLPDLFGPDASAGTAGCPNP